MDVEITDSLYFPPGAVVGRCLYSAWETVADLFGWYQMTLNEAMLGCCCFFLLRWTENKRTPLSRNTVMYSTLTIISPVDLTDRMLF